MSPPHRAIIPAWGILKCKTVPEGCRLYYNYSSSASGLSLAVTDLRTVWNNTLTKADVVKDAQEQNCSIDPSESTTQLRTLLTKLKQSLLEGQNDLGSCVAPEDGEANLQLVVRTRLKLPAPLKLLTWTFCLQEQQASVLADTVIFPLLHEAALMKQHMQSLFQIIKDKDHVLSKLLDKIDNSAIDLSLIFPGITGMKSRKQTFGVSEASKHIPGMAPFDRNSWESSVLKARDSQSTGFSSVLDGFDLNAAGKFAPKDWLCTLPQLDEIYPEGSINDSGTDIETENDISGSLGEQRKASPDASGSSTESDFETLEESPQRGKKRQRQADDHGSSAFTHARTAVVSPSSPIPAGKSQGFKRKTVDNSSDSESDVEKVRQEKPKKQSPAKIGIVGGSKHLRSESQSPSQVSLDQSTPPPRKIGMLGGRKKSPESGSKPTVQLRSDSKAARTSGHTSGCESTSSSASTPVSTIDLSKSPHKDASPQNLINKSQSHNESVEEKAKRKREELKKIQARANATPRKKVRRF